MIDRAQPSSPGWWLSRLLSKLVERRSRYDRLDAYFKGMQGIPIHATKSVREAYRQLMSMSRTNFAELVVEAVRERTLPVGFRTGAEGDELGDAEAWRIWQANSLDADSALVHRACYALGDSYVIVGGVDQELGVPLITPEDPREVITESYPGRRRSTAAALKVFRDDIAGVTRAVVYLPGEVWKASREVTDFFFNETLEEWSWDATTPEMLPTPVVPVVRFANRSDLFGCSSGEFESHLGILDRINYTVLSRLEIATLQAFKQRAVKGVPVKDENGNDLGDDYYADVFRADPGALWVLPATAEIWESGQVDLGPLRQAVRDDVQDLAAVTRTPLFYLSPDAQNGSAEGASLAREGLVFKTQDRLVQVGESWERVMAYAFAFAGKSAAPGSGFEVLWAPPERFSLAERYDAASKAQAAGVPWRSVMSTVLQFSPQEISRMEAERATDTLMASDAGGAAQADPDLVRAQADAMGVLVRAGVEPEDAAVTVGLGRLRFTGATPVSLRLPIDDAAKLEPTGAPGT